MPEFTDLPVLPSLNELHLWLAGTVADHLAAPATLSGLARVPLEAADARSAPSAGGRTNGVP